MKKQIILVSALCLTGYGATAQQAQNVVPGKAGMQPAAIEFTRGQEPDFVRGSVLIKQKDSYIRSTDVILKHSESDQIGQEHFRYQQKMNGIPVEGAMYIVHVAAGKVKSQNGEWLADQPDDLAKTPSISAGAALQSAMKAFGAKSYKWQSPEEEAFIKKESEDATATFLPKGELVYYSSENAVNADKIRLAYKLDLYAQEPIGRRIYFVDAETGAILGMREVMHTANATGTAVTGYSGTKTITSDSYTGGYRLRETGRGNGIQTFNLNKGSNYAGAADFTDADNYWNNANTNKDQYATDAHYGAEMTYDYFKNTFGRNSIDNAGFAIKSYVHFSTNYFNAFWDGSRMTYGDGSSRNSNKPLTSLDVCGHEIAHGLTTFTANLNYSYESGALNEGFSDIFGNVIEIYANPSAASWDIGEAFLTIRSMSNPKAYGQPSTYQATNWATGSADNGGVHTNSGVLNFWFYLLANGGTGSNDYAMSYSVTSIGVAKAAAVAYRTLTVYLTSTSQYIDARTYSIQAAKDLYGESATEVTQVINAWDAVGVGVIPPVTDCSDSYETNETKLTAASFAVNTDINSRIGSKTDKDWYMFTTTNAAPKLKVTLQNLPADYDMRLYNSAVTVQLGSSLQSGTTSESITYNGASVGATYYLQVYGFNGANSYVDCYKLRAATGNVNLQVDTDGDDSTSIMTFGKMAGGIELANDAVTVFPNPAKDNLMLSFTAQEAGTRSISVTDLVGRVIMVMPIEVQQGANIISLPLNNYQSGLYFLKVAGHQTVKFQVTE